MLRVKIEIVPFGNEEQAREIGRLDIFNKGRLPVGPSRETWCLYGALNLSKGEEGQYVGEVTHQRQAGAWQLVKQVIEQLDIDGPYMRATQATRPPPSQE